MLPTKIEQAMSAVTGLSAEELRAKRNELRASGAGAKEFALWLAEKIESEGHTLGDLVKVHQILHPEYKARPEDVNATVLDIVRSLQERRQASGE